MSDDPRVKAETTTPTSLGAGVASTTTTTFTPKTGAEPAKAEPAKTEPKVEPKTEPKVEPKTEPKVEPKAEVDEPKKKAPTKRKTAKKADAKKHESKPADVEENPDDPLDADKIHLYEAPLAKPLTAKERDEYASGSIESSYVNADGKRVFLVIVTDQHGHALSVTDRDDPKNEVGLPPELGYLVT